MIYQKQIYLQIFHKIEGQLIVVTVSHYHLELQTQRLVAILV